MSDLAVRQMVEYKRKGWSEVVIYYPDGGIPRPMQALVDRTPVSDAMNMALPQFYVAVMNDQIYGIDPMLIDRGTDQLEVAEIYGGEKKKRQIQQISELDEEWIVLLLK